MPFRKSFECLWCGRPHTTRSADDLEGWAQLCPECVGKAGENGFLRFRVKAALAERARPTGSAAPSAVIATPASSGRSAAASVATALPSAANGAAPPTAHAAHAAATSDDEDLRDEMLAYYTARAPEYDDWYLRRGRYSHGAIDDMAWQWDLDAAAQWLDAQPLSGEIVELAAGTGWWSPLLAEKGELSLYDAAPATLERARERLVAHNLRAHLHTRDAWAEPDRQVDALFAGFWLSHVPRERLDAFLGLVRRWLKPGGTFLFIDSRDDPQSGAADHDRAPVGPDVQRRRLADGREFRVVKVFHEPRDLEAALRGAGFADADVQATRRFFLLGRAVAP